MIIRKGNRCDLDSAVAKLSNLNVEKMPNDMKVVLELVKKKRSLNQNALLWVWCEQFGDHTGNFKDYIYKYFEDEFCPVVERNINGEATFIKCAKKLEPKKFSEYMEKVYLWLELEADFKVEWPDRGKIEDQRNQ
tara:strand:+ start:798 stop:1202 length:405 start_codon:yes stop_codon:yes gene_type:complete